MPNGIGEKGEERICGNLDLRKRECAKGEKKMEFWAVVAILKKKKIKKNLERRISICLFLSLVSLSSALHLSSCSFYEGRGRV